MALLDAGAGRLAELLVIACLGRRPRRGSIRDKKKPTAPHARPFDFAKRQDISHNPKLPCRLCHMCFFCFVLFTVPNAPAFVRILAPYTLLCPVVAPQTRKSPNLPSTAVFSAA
ncbi:uncharacterized protein TrAtP1_005749 [Trichoderma atroviride]|uniref:uncharacterized protein n=1 Tax=Hypocrea atroviridis TaxID=63577 RepID=UPI003319423C|nr:hypothetical protein TrAtP1_005749 [Trichoderma atroviride]